MNHQTLQENKKYIVIDTCVIQHAGSNNKDKSEKIILCLKKFVLEGYSLVISEFTLYENLNGLWGNKAKKAAKTLHSYDWKVVSNRVLNLAANLGGLYRDEKVDYISDGDKIIAATAILEHALVFTENHRDFPPPFFKLTEHIPISYKKNHYIKTIDLALYEYNSSLIARRINEKNKL